VALRKLSHLTNVGLDGIHSAFLKEIDFRWNDKIQDQGILTIVSNNLNLRSIHLVNCQALTGQSVVYIAQNLAEKLVRWKYISKDFYLFIFFVIGNLGYRRFKMFRFKNIRTFS
jgi:hypothetical protein